MYMKACERNFPLVDTSLEYRQIMQFIICRLHGNARFWIDFAAVFSVHTTKKNNDSTEAIYTHTEYTAACSFGDLIKTMRLSFQTPIETFASLNGLSCQNCVTRWEGAQCTRNEATARHVRSRSVREPKVPQVGTKMSSPDTSTVPPGAALQSPVMAVASWQNCQHQQQGAAESAPFEISLGPCDVETVAYLGFHKGGQSLPSLPSPSPLLPSPALRSRPPYCGQGVWGSALAPPAGPGGARPPNGIW